MTKKIKAGSSDKKMMGLRSAEIIHISQLFSTLKKKLNVLINLRPLNMKLHSPIQSTPGYYIYTVCIAMNASSPLIPLVLKQFSYFY